MYSFRVFDRRARYIAAAFIVALSAFIPAWVSAAQVTERSIQLSSASASATGVTYQVNFTAVNDAEAFVVDFCSNSPLIGQSCTPPTGMNASGAASTTNGFTDVTGSTNKVVVVGTIDVSTEDEVSVDITGINNPTAAGTLYARIVTFASDTAADAYTSGTPGTIVDEGGVAMSITPTIGVSAAVLESLTFCVSGADTIAANCASGVTAPTVRLGTVVGANTVIDASDTYEGSIYTQLSTNAVNGAIVRIKSNTTGCGGLSRIGAASHAAGCGIAPALAGGIADGEAKFGVKTGTAAGQSPSTGTLRAYDNGGSPYYNASTFKLRYVDATDGITSTYGDPFLDTAGAPVQNMEMPITFGASASANTPAGRYSADLSLIATGTF